MSAGAMIAATGGGAHSVAGAAALSAAAEVEAEVAVAADLAAHSCVMTHVSLLAHRLTGSVPLLGVCCYIGQWMFLGCVIFSSCLESCRDKSSAYFESEDDEFDPSSAQAAAASGQASTLGSINRGGPVAVNTNELDNLVEGEDPV